MIRALAAAALICGLNAAVLRLYRPALLPAPLVHLSAENAARDAALIALGMRRLAADVEFVQMLVYYGTPEEPEGNPYEYLEHYYSKGAHECRGNHEGGVYPELGTRALRILELDPRFAYAPLYAAGAIAFNLQRPDEAVSILKEARTRDPKDWRYASYIAAIGFHKTGDADRVLAELAPVLRDPDCPTMLKNIAAFLNVRLGRKSEAARLYREILDSRDPSYRDNARKSLAKLTD